MWPGWDSVDRLCGPVEWRGFPYRVVYFVQPAELLIVVAVAHAKRKPGYWRDRLASN